MDLTLMIEVGILIVSGVFVIIAIYKSRKAGNKEVPWEKIRPILTETFFHVKEIQDAKKVGYQAIENYAVLMVYNQVRKASFLTDMEKSLLSQDLIRSILAPRLKEIYEAQQER